MHVLIVGGGLGGLALAQCLRKQGISYEVFERDADEHARFQGWAIALHSILDELADAFPDDVPGLAESTNHLLPLKLNAQIGLYFPGKDDRGDTRIGVEDTPEMPIVRAERMRLRRTLATNIPIQWGKRVSRIVHDDNGVEAFFEDGTSAKGDILVGADGINSSVRTHLLKKPGSELLKIVPLAAIVGEVTLHGDAFRRQLELGHSAYIYQSPELGFMNFCGLHHTLPNGISGRHYWMFMQPDTEIAKPDHWLQKATQQEKLDHVLKAAAKMPAKFRELFELTPAEGIKKEPHLWKVLEMDNEYGTLPAERVVLLGDAVHPMTPFRGEGGYHTLVDAMLLSRALGKVQGKDIAAIKEAIAEYNAEIVERGSDAVRTSRNVQKTEAPKEGQSKYVSARQDAKPMPWENIELVEIKA